MNPFGMLPVEFTNHVKRARRRQREKRDAGRDTLLDDLHVTHCEKSASLQMHEVTLFFCF